ncbi:hypothetical protein D3C80_1552010 [compost metagenome]
MKDIHIGELVYKKFRESDLDIEDLADRLYTTKADLMLWFEFKDWSFDRIMRAGEALDVDLWEELAPTRTALKFSIPIPSDKKHLVDELITNLRTEADKLGFSIK